MLANTRKPGTKSGAGVRALRTAVAYACFLAGSGMIGAQTSNVGWVVDVNSAHWHVNGDKSPLAKGTYLPSEGILSNSSPSDGDYLVVANLHGDIIRRLRCTNSSCGVCIENDSCANPIAPLPKATTMSP